MNARRQQLSILTVVAVAVVLATIGSRAVAAQVSASGLPEIVCSHDDLVYRAEVDLGEAVPGGPATPHDAADAWLNRLAPLLSATPMTLVTQHEELALLAWGEPQAVAAAEVVRNGDSWTLARFEACASVIHPAAEIGSATGAVPATGLPTDGLPIVPGQP